MEDCSKECCNYLLSYFYNSMCPLMEHWVPSVGGFSPFKYRTEIVGSQPVQRLVNFCKLFRIAACILNFSTLKVWTGSWDQHLRHSLSRSKYVLLYFVPFVTYFVKSFHSLPKQCWNSQRPAVSELAILDVRFSMDKVPYSFYGPNTRIDFPCYFFDVATPIEFVIDGHLK